jgi:spermidine/putrescine transport system permease protein
MTKEWLRLRRWFLTPSAALLFTLLGIPLMIVVGYSLMTRGTYGGTQLPITLENYARVFDPIYLTVLWRSIGMSLVSTLICIIAGFPLALFISRAGRWKNLYLALVIVPFWTSLLIRLYAWMFLLRDTGLINTTLQSAGIITAPLPLLYNDFAVVLGLVYGFLPFTVLPLYATLERLDKSLLEASADLGAGPWDTFWKVLIPLCAPGIQAAALLVFIPCLGSYLTPDLLGGGKSMMIGNIIHNQFTNARDWPFGAAISAVLMLVVMAAVVSTSRKDSESLL